VGGVQDFAAGAAQGGGAIRLLEIAGRRKLYAGSAGGFGIATGEENGQVRKATQESGGSGGPPMRHDDNGGWRAQGSPFHKGGRLARRRRHPRTR
jgi:hypothetical protein